MLLVFYLPSSTNKQPRDPAANGGFTGTIKCRADHSRSLQLEIMALLSYHRESFQTILREEDRVAKREEGGEE